VLNDVSFSLPAGSRTIVFASGRDTPTIVAGLLPRFYDPTSGVVLFDGQDIRRGTLRSVRDQIAWIVSDPGAPGLITGTIAENINCGDRQFTTADVIDAAKVVHAYDFIQQLPQGFETIVGEHGTSLSASETMRIGLARAVLRKPAAIVIDEPPVLPDVQETELLADSVRRAAAGRWLIVMARRLPTLRAAERILLFHDGQLVGDGSHAELLAQSELYRHLNYVRFNEFGDGVR
jgi:ABC-type multidrug transport system fused ATPase/permease subunit